MLSSEDHMAICSQLGRDITPLEAAAFENLWSEHCSYRSTKALLRTLPTDGKNVIIGPGDDAAIVSFSEKVALAIGMESHNHPSYVDPYDGAATGVGGIVRDIISMGAKPIALMDPLCFGTLDSEKTKSLFEHVVSGIGDYGNCIGVPVVRGDLIFDESYRGNPLVNVVAVGMLDPENVITGRVKTPGNRLILYGARTGRDGLGGASFASRDLSEDAEAEDRPSVQVGDPYIEKLLIDATMAMCSTGKIRACRDLGAAGFAGASSEMSSTLGARIIADNVPLRESGMNEVEIMLAESQERMLAEVAPEDVELIGSIAEKYDLAWADVGEVIAEPRYIVEFKGAVVCDLPIDLLVGGAPACDRGMQPYSLEKPFTRPDEDIRTLCLKVLAHPECAAKDWVFSQYDHDVQLRTVSLGPDAACIRLDGDGLYLTCGCNPRHIHLRPRDGTANAVLENVSNLACYGAEPICTVDCLNFASPVHPEINWQIAESIAGMGEMCRLLDAPIVGGNVSLYNESDEFDTQIKPTPMLGMIGKGEVIRRTPPKDGTILALIGTTKPEFGGSILDCITGCGGDAPEAGDPAIVVSIRNMVRSGGFAAVTDLSRGGLLTALAKIAPRCSVEIRGDPIGALFSESYARFLVAVNDRTILRDLPHTILGTVGGDALTILAGDETIRLTDEDLARSASTIGDLMRID
ncbi:phosphoribosylformylglycinamidine synthase [Methanocalculus alkaliphilus]|uniref:phosphoribosylformylglycinamidine synthase subunit PurL n=1 Tax=Methanocalculus alkaliphilus TaxID=768730 RepID=UPI00209FA3B4|nr:phosphoribosylformylglycinamidine synthase subunit PurL [Methanocalculus alkaliphilus]MCP1714367.1 phosphoribosylformylglycinamidine synthase [Methanocalculus alkaliphilus]